MKKYEAPKPPTLRILGAFLGAAIPAITLLSLMLVIGWFTHGRGMRWSFQAVAEYWPRLMHVSAGLAVLGFVMGFDRLLNLIAPFWSAITWLWNKERSFDQRASDFFSDYFFSVVFTILVVALVYLYILKA